VSDEAYQDARGWITRNDASVWHVFLPEARQALTVSVSTARVEKVAAAAVPYESLLVETVAELRARLAAAG